MDEENIILGIDPGSTVTGYGLIRRIGRGYELIDYGAVRPKSKSAIDQRFLHIFDALENLFATHKISALSVETQYVHKNPQSAITLGMARGMALLAAARAGVPVFEYTPSKAKKAVTGNGNASKAQVVEMTSLLLKLKKPPTPEDAADALALAMCHAHYHKPIRKKG
ncbi:MAG: Crossover junction endodeoxyribonuclease RuvC [Chlamydiia bacterium]|nr:Crossover junction endodeoxyribonuclease RuvC [Chlamydiia bacterium]